MKRPLIGMTPWRQLQPTFMHPVTDLYTLDTFYVGAVEAAGGNAALMAWATSVEDAAQRLAPFDALVLTGGQDIDPARYGHDNDGSVEMWTAGDVSDEAFVHAALAQGKPILAICRGQQVVNVALGGTLIQHMWDVSPHHPARQKTSDEAHNAESFIANRHPVALEPGSQIRELAGTGIIEVNSLHHQSIDRLGEGLIVTGTTPDGIIESVEHESHPLLAVQWHPERTNSDLSRSLFSWLVSAASQRDIGV